MSRRIIVVGAGFAGLAAAFRAKRSGAAVTLIDGGVGASSLSSGAVDDTPWDDRERAAATLGLEGLSVTPLADDAAEFVRELDLWDVPEKARVKLATAAGVVREARGRDRSLLDLARVEGVVALPRVARAGWDADALARTLADDPRAHGLRFVAVDADVIQFEDELYLGDTDLAARHDASSRIAWLADRLRPVVAAAHANAVLLGPWLGVEQARASELTEKLGIPAGEVLVGAGSLAGLRFEKTRARFLHKLDLPMLRARVTSVEVDEQGVQVALEGSGEALRAGAVVLAIGGVAAGGVIYDPPEHAIADDLPKSGHAAFRLSLEAAVTLGASRALGVVSSMQGPELDTEAWPRGGHAGLLERIGIRCEGVRAGESIFAAGDVVAGRARTVLEAVRSGLAAGDAALEIR